MLGLTGNCEEFILVEVFQLQILSIRLWLLHGAYFFAKFHKLEQASWLALYARIADFDREWRGRISP